MSKKEILKNPEKFEQVISSVFKNIDSDGNGEIDTKELTKALSDFDKDEIKQILKKLDDDKSGKISYEEFKNNIKIILEEILE